jgi:hypothetical protein
MHYLGLHGMPRRVYTYPAGMGWDGLKANFVRIPLVASREPLWDNGIAGEAAYALASGRRTPGGGIALHAVFAGSFAMALAITIHAALASRREHGSPERQRFFAALAPAMGALVCLVIAAQWVAAAILPACG